MSRYIATRAIRGANLIVAEAEEMLQRALAEKGPETPVAFPNTAYFLPVILGMTGIEVSKLGDLVPVLQRARELLHPVPPDHRWTPYLGETLDCGMATLLAEETIEAIRFVYKLDRRLSRRRGGGCGRLLHQPGVHAARLPARARGWRLSQWADR